MKKLILILLAICSLQNVNCAQANINDALPIVDISTLPSDFQCPICLNGVEEDNVLCQTSCNHIFHKKCMLRNLASNENKSCPMCRAPQEAVLYTALDLAVACNDQNLVTAQAIIDYGILPDERCVLIVCTHNNTELARILFANGIDGVDINQQVNNITTYYMIPGLYLNALMHACNNGNLELVRLLLTNGADINYKFITKCAFTEGKIKILSFVASPLFIACCNNNIELAQFLIENGARKIDHDDEYYDDYGDMMMTIYSFKHTQDQFLTFLKLLFTDMAMAKFSDKLSTYQKAVYKKAKIENILFALGLACEVALNIKDMHLIEIVGSYYGGLCLSAFSYGFDDLLGEKFVFKKRFGHLLKNK